MCCRIDPVTVTSPFNGFSYSEGGATVSVNVDADEIFYSEINQPVCEMIEYIYNHDLNDILEYIEHEITINNLALTNKEEYYVYRECATIQKSNTFSYFSSLKIYITS